MQCQLLLCCDRRLSVRPGEGGIARLEHVTGMSRQPRVLQGRASSAGSLLSSAAIRPTMVAAGLRSPADARTLEQPGGLRGRDDPGLRPLRHSLGPGFEPSARAPTNQPALARYTGSDRIRQMDRVDIVRAPTGLLTGFERIRGVSPLHECAESLWPPSSRRPRIGASVRL